MKKIILLMLMCLSIGTLLAQRRPHSPEMRMQRVASKLQEKLNLDDRQKSRIVEIHQEFAQKLKQTVQTAKENPENRETIREELKLLRNAKDQEVKEVLNEEQFAQYQEIQKKMGKRNRMQAHKAQMFKNKLHKNPEFRAELKAYRQEKIQPVIEQQRAKFDELLSASEKATITQIRGEMESMKAQVKEVKEIIKGLKEDGIHPSDEQKQMFQKLRKTRKLHKEQLKSIMEVHQADLQNLWGEIENERITWRNDLKSIAEKYAGEEMPDHRKHHKFGRLSKIIAGERFLLMKVKKQLINKNAAGASTFPNPSDFRHTLAYKVGQKGKVKITLLNQEGHIIRTLVNENKNAGEYQVQVNTEDLKAGIYLYKIQTGNSLETKRLVIK